MYGVDSMLPKEYLCSSDILNELFLWLLMLWMWWEDEDNCIIVFLEYFVVEILIGEKDAYIDYVLNPVVAVLEAFGDL